MSNHLQFVCHTCRVRTGKLGERMNRQETTARGAVRARVQIRDACRAVSALDFASRESLAVFFGVGYRGSPEPDLETGCRVRTRSAARRGGSWRLDGVDRCAACEEHYDADRKRLAANEQRELERKERTRAVSADWTCDRCGEQTWFYEPGPRSTIHHGTAALSDICGGTWRRS